MGEGFRFEPEVKEAGAGDRDGLTTITDLEPGDHVSRQLAWIQLPGLGQRHQGVGLVIAELRVRARSDQDAGEVSVGQDGVHRFLEALFDELVREHGLGCCLSYLVTWLQRCGLPYVTM
jgi:hypothetical protein